MTKHKQEAYDIFLHFFAIAMSFSSEEVFCYLVVFCCLGVQVKSDGCQNEMAGLAGVVLDKLNIATSYCQ